MYDTFLPPELFSGDISGSFVHLRFQNVTGDFRHKSCIYEFYDQSIYIMCESPVLPDKITSTSLSLQVIQQIFSLLPLPGYVLSKIVEISGTLHLYFAHSLPKSQECPQCHRVSCHTRGSYYRTLHGLPLSGKPCLLHVPVYRFHCTNQECGCKYFSESLSPVACKYSRLTSCLETMYVNTVLEMSATKASMILSSCAAPVSASTLIRHLLRYPFAAPCPSSDIAIDDFAMKRGVVYASIVVDHQTSRPVAVLSSRNSDEVCAWLRQHPQVKTVTRDGALCFKKGIELASPQITQVTDRFHLMQLLTELLKQYLTEEVERYNRACKVVKKQEVVNVPQESIYQIVYNSIINMRNKKERQVYKEWEAVKQVKGKKLTPKKISDLTGVPVKAVWKYRKMTKWQTYTPQQQRLLSKCRLMARSFQQSLWRREEKLVYGELPLTVRKNVRTAELELLYNRVRKVLANKKEGKTDKKCKDNPLTLRQLIKALYNDNPTQNPVIENFFRWNEKTDMCMLHTIVWQFKRMIAKEPGPYTLDKWIRMAQCSEIDAMEKFAEYLKTDFKAVWNAIHSSLSNGVAEGNVNRAKCIKRQMYGRANLKLLATKIIYAKSG